jgi:hypothetical protein
MLELGEKIESRRIQLGRQVTDPLLFSGFSLQFMTFITLIIKIHYSSRKAALLFCHNQCSA